MDLLGPVKIVPTSVPDAMVRERMCSWCHLPMSWDGGSVSPSPYHTVGPHERNMVFHHKCSDVHRSYTHLYGYTQGVQHSWIKEDRKTKETVQMLGERHEKNLREWQAWLDKILKEHRDY